MEGVGAPENETCPAKVNPTSVFPSGADELTKDGAIFESGVIPFEADEGPDVPTPLVAVIVKVYWIPFVKPLTTIGL